MTSVYIFISYLNLFLPSLNESHDKIRDMILNLTTTLTVEYKYLKHSFGHKCVHNDAVFYS